MATDESLKRLLMKTKLMEAIKVYHGAMVGAGQHQAEIFAKQHLPHPWPDGQHLLSRDQQI